MYVRVHAARAALALSLFPLAFAHMAAWDPSAYSFNSNGYTPADPLSGRSFSAWWFHGDLGSKPPGPPMALPAGGKVTIQIACQKKFTSFGSNGDGKSACPDDAPSYHAGVPVDPTHYLGCGLAIAYISDATQVKPADFTIFSVNTQCVSGLYQDFEVPAAMPACPGGKCTCAWFWQGQDSDNEMYMTGFECTVTNSQSTTPVARGVPPRYCGGSPSSCVTGPKQPMYWANESPNIDFSGDYFKKPSYNEKWGYKNGAQNDIFGGSAGPAPPNPVAPPGAAPPGSTAPPTPTTMTTVPVPTTTGGGGGGGGCSWVGHCKGASCSSDNDCSDSLTCQQGKCA